MVEFHTSHLSLQEEGLVWQEELQFYEKGGDLQVSCLQRSAPVMWLKMLLIVPWFCYINKSSVVVYVGFHISVIHIHTLKLLFFNIVSFNYIT